VPRFDATVGGVSLSQNYFTPLVKDSQQSATDYIIAGRDFPCLTNVWTIVPTYIVLPPGACWIIRPDAVNIQLTIRVRGRHYA
jgi:hypothetical protein